VEDAEETKGPGKEEVEEEGPGKSPGIVFLRGEGDHLLDRCAATRLTEAARAAEALAAEALRVASRRRRRRRRSGDHRRSLARATKTGGFSSNERSRWRRYHPLQLLLAPSHPPRLSHPAPHHVTLAAARDDSDEAAGFAAAATLPRGFGGPHSTTPWQRRSLDVPGDWPPPPPPPPSQEAKRERRVTFQGEVQTLGPSPADDEGREVMETEEYVESRV